MLTEEAKIAVVGAGAIGGVTAAFIKQAGYDLELVCKHRALADKINDSGLKINGLKGAHQVRMHAVETIPDLSQPKDLIFLATKANDCVAAAQELIPFLKPDSVVVSLQNGISETALAGALGKERVVGVPAIISRASWKSLQTVNLSSETWITGPTTALHSSSRCWMRSTRRAFQTTSWASYTPN